MADVLIVGAGLAGLACARELTERGLSSIILEASDGPGGRTRTDRVDGFLLDRGFQVLLTAYPEAQRVLDYAALDLKYFEPGALVRFDDRFHHFVDPWRRPGRFTEGLFSPVATFGDKLKMAGLRRRVCRGSLDELMAAPETSTQQALEAAGFSPTITEHFFRPFLAGIFLERGLETSSRMFDFVFRMFAQGEAALPARGMGSLAEQMAKKLPEGTLWQRARVMQATGGAVRLETGEELRGKVTVIATEQREAARLLSQMVPSGFRGTTCFYFAAEKAPLDQPMLVLNGGDAGPVNNLCVPSLVAPSYAPAGLHLVAVSVIGEASMSSERLEGEVRDQLARWFGHEVRRWRRLGIYHLPYCLPPQTVAAGGIHGRESRLQEGLYVCGDYCDSASIQGALASGRRAAEAVLRDIGLRITEAPDGSSGQGVRARSV